MIVIKRIKKSGHAHHGGAWKVAYADFVTAMMAFFLLLWLLNAVSQEQLEGISDYFAPISTARSTSGGGGLLQGQTVDKKGVFSVTERRAAGFDFPEERTATFAQYGEPVMTVPDQDRDKKDSAAGHPPDAQDGEQSEAAKAAARAREEAQFQAAEAALREAIEATPELRQLAASLLIDNTPEGLRIQITDQDRLPMFPRGSAQMYQHTERLLDEVAKVIRGLPQQIEIAGHTDATPYRGDGAYTNWELSSDRANAARRKFLDDGLSEARISRVVGRAATSPLIAADPRASANRRLSVILLRGTAVGT
jgi:chemotaxis protein MotB